MFPVESQAQIRSEPRIPLGTALGPVRLAVTDRDRALAVWRDVVGLAVVAESAGELALGVGSQVLIELELGAARPVVPHSLGLYHVALHVPTRRDLAAFAARALHHRVRISPTDHLVSEAIYLWDFDGNGIEMTFETPERGTYGEPESGYYARTVDGQAHSGREPIDLEDLLGELDGFAEPPPVLPVGTRIGHVHVHVNDLHEAMRFYRDGLGFGGLFLIARFGMGDVRLNYMPHAVAFNVWAGPGARQPEAGSAGLRHFTIRLPDRAALEAVARRLADQGIATLAEEGGFSVKDPAGNLLRIRSAH